MGLIKRTESGNGHDRSSGNPPRTPLRADAQGQCEEHRAKQKAEEMRRLIPEREETEPSELGAAERREPDYRGGPKRNRNP
jgi:hypothetical protein